MREGVAVARGFAVGVGMRPHLSHYLPKSAIDAPIRLLHRWPQRPTVVWMAGHSFAGPAEIAAGYGALASELAGVAAHSHQALRWSLDDPLIYRAPLRSYLQPDPAQAPIEHTYRPRSDNLPNWYLNNTIAESIDHDAAI